MVMINNKEWRSGTDSKRGTLKCEGGSSVQAPTAVYAGACSGWRLQPYMLAPTAVYAVYAVKQSV